MTSFSQLGDPVCAAGLCEHHGAAYAERLPVEAAEAANAGYFIAASNATIVQQQIVITERCCLAVNASTLTFYGPSATGFEIERPIGSIRTTQRDDIIATDLTLYHHAAWEVLDPGTYTYYLMNRSGIDQSVIAAWLKIIASDCEG